MSEIIKRHYGITRKGVRYEVELKLHIDAIAQTMVNNAARNASGKTSFMDGSIQAHVIKKEDAP